MIFQRTTCKRCVVPGLVALMMAFWLSALTGCAATGTSSGKATAALEASPYVVGQRTVYGAKGAYEAALVLAVAYAELPRCKPGAVPLTCSDKAAVDQIVKARDVARDALKAAEGAAYSPHFGTNVIDTAAAAADAALKAFVSIANTYGGKR